VSVGAGELPVDEDDDAGLLGARAGIVAWENARGRRRDDHRFLFGEKSQRDFEGLGCFFLREQARDPAIKGIDQHAANAGRG